MTAAPQDPRPLLDFTKKIDDEVTAYRKERQWENKAELWKTIRDGRPAAPRAEEPVFHANILGNLLDRKIASVVQSQPDIRVAARSPDYGPSAQVLTTTIQAILDSQDFPSRVEQAADFCATFGHAGFMVAWNPYGDYGKGDIEIQVLDPRRFFVDHHCRSAADLAQAQYIRIDTPMPVAVIKRTWPGVAADVTGDDELAAYAPSPRGLGSWFGTPFKRSFKPTNRIDGPYEWATVRQYWVRSGQTRPDGEPVFPHGRRILRVADTILEDGPNPYWDGGWPVVIWDWRVDADTYLGRSDVEDARFLQSSYDRLGNSIMKNVFLNSAINVIADWNAMTPEEWKKLDSRAARVIKVAPGRRFDLTAPPELPPQYLATLDTLTNAMERILGVPEVSQGRRQPGVIAQGSVEGLQQAAETLARASARRLEYAVERMGHLLVSRIIQFYTSDRIMQITAPTGYWQDYTYKRSDLLPPDKEGDEDWKRHFYSEFKFRVTPLSTMPQSRVQRGLLALQLYQAGIIDHEEVLKFIEWPDRESVMKRVAEQAAANPPTDEKGGKQVRANRSGTQMKLG